MKELVDFIIDTIVIPILVIMGLTAMVALVIASF